MFLFLKASYLHASFPWHWAFWEYFDVLAWNKDRFGPSLRCLFISFLITARSPGVFLECVLELHKHMCISYVRFLILQRSAAVHWMNTSSRVHCVIVTSLTLLSSSRFPFSELPLFLFYIAFPSWTSATNHVAFLPPLLFLTSSNCLVSNSWELLAKCIGQIYITTRHYIVGIVRLLLKSLQNNC